MLLWLFIVVVQAFTPTGLMINRYNVNVLLYGQTGSGKSYTLSGTEGDPGIIQRACEDLFKHLAIRPKVKVSASFIEIYNEQVIE